MQGMLQGKKICLALLFMVFMTCIIVPSTYADTEYAIPHAEYLLKAEEKEGDIRSDLCRSEDTLMLKSRYRDDNDLELDLDEMMGREVWTRKIEFEGYKNDRIGELRALSVWGNVSLYGVRLVSDERKDDIEIRLGRVEAVLEQSLKKKLRGKSIKSDFLEVSGENYGVNAIDVEIPYRESDGMNLKALRYDEWARSFTEEDFIVDWLNSKVIIENTWPGIFVLVE